jgi:hypothetical protein
MEDEKETRHPAQRLPPNGISFSGTPGDNAMTTHKRAFTLTDLLAWVLAAALLVAIILPCLGQARAGGLVRFSLAHLMEHSIAHTMYAADWNGRQYTNIVDDISIYGEAVTPAFENYRIANGGEPHPPVLLGDDVDGNPWGYYMFTSGNYLTAPPMSFTGNFAGFGHFRFTNAKPFHDYMGDPRFYAPAFYAVTDTIPYPNVKPLINEPGEYVPNDSNTPFFASYVTSPAAMFDPDVMRSELDGGWQNPWAIDHGHTSPPLTSALYPDLKTHVLEHHWLQIQPLDLLVARDALLRRVDPRAPEHRGPGRRSAAHR